MFANPKDPYKSYTFSDRSFTVVELAHVYRNVHDEYFYFLPRDTKVEGVEKEEYDAFVKKHWNSYPSYWNF